MPVVLLTTPDGFGNTFRSESIPNSLPKLGHNPADVPYGLYTEGMTGSAFTAPRAKNRRSWLYRIRPSVVHYPFEPYTGNSQYLSTFLPGSAGLSETPQQLRWDPLVVKGAANLDFVDGIRSICGAGEPQMKNGVAIHFYEFGKDMERKAFYSADGALLIVPVKGELLITTEFGKIHLPPKHIGVIQRTQKFTVSRVNGQDGETANGYMIESFKGPFELPELGCIGGNGLANLEDFQTPVASYLDEDVDWTIVSKHMGQLYTFKQHHSPYDVVSWMGNYVPYRYDITKFCQIGSVSYDHPDPSTNVCLCVPSDTPGTNIIDFLIFGPRWSVAEDTFRPQWFHRNCMTEFMATIDGLPEQKAGCNLHNISCAHGPDSDVTAFSHGPNKPTGPVKNLEGIHLFMVETNFHLATTEWAIKDSGKVQDTYWKDMWQKIERHDKLPQSA